MKLTETEKRLRKNSKRNWEVVNRVGNQLEMFLAEENQAKAYWKMRYDTEFTDLREAKIIDLDDLEIGVSECGINLWLGNECKVSTLVVGGVFKLLGEDGELLDEVSVEDLMTFPTVSPYFLCAMCENSGSYGIQYCDKPASMCCGGCEVGVECDCPNVVFKDYL